MASGSLLQIYPFSVKPSAPPVGAFLFYMKTDNFLYLEDSSGTEYPFGTTSAITQLTGDVSAIGPGSAIATVNFVGGESASDVASATAAYLSATDLNNPSTIVLRDSFGNFSSGTITASLIGNVTGNVSGSSASFTGSLAGDVTGTQSTTTIASTIVTGKLLTGLVPGVNTPILNTDSILIALEKLQAQVSGASSTAITQLTGDVSATGPGSVVATVNFVGGSSAADIHSAELLANAATSSNTASAIVRRDASGNFSANIISAALNGNATTSTSFTGSLVGDVTGIQSATVVSFVGGSSAADVHSAELLANAATDSNTASAIVRRDASGNFSASTITANLTGNASGTASNITGLLAIVNGGTNSSAVLSNDRIMISSGGSIVEAAAITPARALVSNASGIPIASVTTAIELGYVSGVTSAIQTQINSISGSAITALTGDVVAIGPGSVVATISAGAVTTTKLGIVTDGITLDQSGAGSTLEVKTGGISNPQVSATAAIAYSKLALANSIVNSDVSTSAAIDYSKLATLTINRALQSDGSGVISVSAVTSTELGYVSGVTSAIQTQLNGKQATGNYITALTGDVVATGPGSVSATIQANVVTNAKLAQMPTNTIKGNNTGVTANPLDLTTAQVNTLLGTVTTIGSFNGQIPNANGAVISANSIFFQSASISNPGMVDTTTQSFAGNKTFTGTVSITPSSTSALVVNTTSFIHDSVNNALGIGIQPATNTFVDALNSTAASKTLQLTGYGVGSTVGTRGRFARGTSGTPAAAQSGDIINFWSARGYGATQFAAASTAVINAIAGETFTDTSNLTYLAFNTTPTGSVTSAENMRVASAGVTIGPQSSSTAIHAINGGLKVNRRTITANLTIDTTTTDYLVLCNNSGAITITLPAPTDGRVLVIKDIAGTANTNNVTIARHASEKIEGLAASFIFQTNWGVLNIYSDGTDWYIN